MSAPPNRRTRALLRLPPKYALALRLRDAGAPEQLIADRLGIESEAVGPMMTVAEAKLAAILAGPGD